jgi:hypothetical protein
MTAASIAEVDAEIDRVHEEIRRLQAHIVELRKRRNDLVPICRLPSEILVKIICFVQGRDEAFLHFYSAYHPTSTQWTRFIHRQKSEDFI